MKAKIIAIIAYIELILNEIKERFKIVIKELKNKNFKWYYIAGFVLFSILSVFRNYSRFLNTLITLSWYTYSGSVLSDPISYILLGPNASKISKAILSALLGLFSFIGYSWFAFIYPEAALLVISVIIFGMIGYVITKSCDEAYTEVFCGQK